MIILKLKDSGELLGSIDEGELKFLVDQLEEESETDTDYYISPATIDMLRQNGAAGHLLALLTKAVGDSEGVEVAWSAE